MLNVALLLVTKLYNNNNRATDFLNDYNPKRKHCVLIAPFSPYFITNTHTHAHIHLSGNLYGSTYMKNVCYSNNNNNNNMV